MDQVEQVRERTDLVSLIGEYVPVKKAGRNFKINCPFHNEKTPSLVISSERQIWRCFGCGKGGDCFTFVMLYERMEFGEALRMLAQKAGIELQRNAVAAGVASKKDKLYEINAAAAEFYHYVLTKHPGGKKALEYVLENRKILPQTLKTFKLGYAPKQDALIGYLIKKKQYSLQDIQDAGLVTRHYSRSRDFFYDRLMFPLYDHRDNIIGFSGRALVAEMQPKYINTPETLIYHKGQVFFGLNIAKEAVKNANQVIIMEGEFDVISSFQQGITHVVAVKGTALTEDQVNLIARFAQKVTLCFDMDKAGQEAVKRSLSVIEKKGLRTTVIVVPNGKDADEAIKEGPTAFKLAVKHDIDVYEFLLTQTSKAYDKRASQGKKAIGDILLPIFSNIQNEIVKEHYLTKLSGELQVSLPALQREIERLDKRTVVKQQEVTVHKTQRPREEILEEYLIALLVQYELLRELLHVIEDVLSIYKFKLPVHEHIVDHLMAYAEAHKVFKAELFLGTLPSELVPIFDTCFLLPLAKFESNDDYLAEIKKVANEMYGLFVHNQIKVMGQLISEKEKTGEVEELEKLQRQLNQLVSLLKKKP